MKLPFLGFDVTALFSRENGQWVLSERARGSLQAYTDAVRGAFESEFRVEDPATEEVANIWARDIVVDDPQLGTAVIADVEGKTMAVAFRQNDDGSLTFASPDNWIPVVQTYAPVATPDDADSPTPEEAPAAEGAWTRFGNTRIFVKGQ